MAEAKLVISKGSSCSGCLSSGDWSLVGSGMFGGFMIQYLKELVL